MYMRVVCVCGEGTVPGGARLCDVINVLLMSVTLPLLMFYKTCEMTSLIQANMVLLAFFD